MDQFLPHNFFFAKDFDHSSLFDPTAPVWRALAEPLDRLFASWKDWEIHCEIPTGVHVLDGPIYAAAGCRIEPGAVLAGPLILGAGCEVRTGAYLRGRIVLGRNCIVGAHTEVKNAVFLDGARAPHQNYVGDSVLGADVNLGAGTILSNVKNVGREITLMHEGTVVHTGLRKLGAVLGDGCKTGCNTVLNPGTLMGPGSITYPNATVRAGLYPARTMIKVRQKQQQTVMRIPNDT